MSATQLRYLAAANAFVVAVYAAGTGLAGDANSVLVVVVVIAMIAQIIYLLVPSRRKKPQPSETESL
ncbi:hypothetical protein KXS11_10450 [Plantibacter flavus]|uniref:hypothetical protein n=1 Tax=Plantibacter flavus TaxID=150123 RepID=UPI003F135644